jgi:hypothetical protein
MQYLHIGRGTTNMGTFREDEVRQGLLTGRFFRTDLAWREGMEGWKPLGEFPELAPPPAEPPPLPSHVSGTSDAGLSEPEHSLNEPRDGLPWDARNSLGLVNAWLGTVKLVLLEPAKAFSGMRRAGGLFECIFYALIGGTIGGVFGAIYQQTMQTMQHGNTMASRVPHNAGFVVGVCLMMPVFVTLGLFISSGIIHLSLMLIGGARQPFETTFRTVCFATGSTAFLQVLPVCGGLIAAVWNIVVVAIGLAKTHEISTGKAVLAVLLPSALCCGLILLAVVAAASGFAAAGLEGR